ncbi:MAG TPA: hypothetical protein VMJ32_16690 [Pirellulales bacterium]|nr:hypothetical protein [Pirellulales bacterium]
MRLTLRTMLAYLDGILEPADRDEIARKIDESEFARQLVQRLRDCAGNPQLAAPKVSAKNTGLDPNLVAEYLDNTLAGERVPEFEKACLESDIYLAEVAACHQILTMVLAQPADIDLEMKQLMYGVIHQAAQQASKSSVADRAADERGPALPDDIWVKPQRRKPEIPDYLREGPKRFRWKPVVAAALLLLILVVAITMVLGPLDRTHPIARLLGFGPAAENQANPAEAGNEHGSNTETPNTTDHASTSGTSKSEPRDQGSTTKPPDAPSTNPTPLAGSANASDNSGTEKTASDSSQTDTKTAAQPSNPASDTTPAATVTANTAASAAGTVTPPAAAANPLPSAGLPSTVLPSTGPSTTANPLAPEPDASTVGSNLKPPPTPEPPAGNAVVPPQSAVAGHEAPGNAQETTTHGLMLPPQTRDATVPVDNTPLGRFLPSKDVVLLKFDAAANQWSRVPSGASVTAGEQLLVLPTYRPTITLSTGITLEIPDETLLQLQPANTQGVPTVKLVYGRLVAITAGKPGPQLSLDAGGMKGVISFVDAEAMLGVEVRRYYSAGSNPEVEEPHVAADLYAARGHLEWTAADGTVTALEAPQRWVLSADPTEAAAGPTAAPNMPKWIEPEQLRSFDEQASEYLTQSLSDDKPLLVALGEMVEHRKAEYKSLAAQSLALLDEFEPLVATFNDSEQRPMWSVDIASVKAAIARGPTTAIKVHEAFVKQRGDDLGKDLYRMFLGYTKEQLQNGEAAKLVEFLDHDNLDCRVLAFANLQEITNKTLLYRPDAPAASRAQALRRWQEELHNGAIVPRDNPQK